MRFLLAACAILGFGSAAARAANEANPSATNTPPSISLMAPNEPLHNMPPVRNPPATQPAAGEDTAPKAIPLNEDTALAEELNQQLAARLAKLIACPRNGRKLSAVDRKWENVRYMKHAFNDWKNAIVANKLPMGNLKLAHAVEQKLRQQYGVDSENALKTWLQSFDDNFGGVTKKIATFTDEDKKLFIGAALAKDTEAAQAWNTQWNGFVKSSDAFFSKPSEKCGEKAEHTAAQWEDDKAHVVLTEEKKKEIHEQLVAQAKKKVESVAPVTIAAPPTTSEAPPADEPLRTMTLPSGDTVLTSESSEGSPASTPPTDALVKTADPGLVEKVIQYELQHATLSPVAVDSRRKLLSTFPDRSLKSILGWDNKIPTMGAPEIKAQPTQNLEETQKLLSRLANWKNKKTIDNPRNAFRGDVGPQGKDVLPGEGGISKNAQLSHEILEEEMRYGLISRKQTDAAARLGILNKENTQTLEDLKTRYQIVEKLEPIPSKTEEATLAEARKIRIRSYLDPAQYSLPKLEALLNTTVTEALPP